MDYLDDFLVTLGGSQGQFDTAIHHQKHAITRITFLKDKLAFESMNFVRMWYKRTDLFQRQMLEKRLVPEQGHDFYIACTHLTDPMQRGIPLFQNTLTMNHAP
ncbi:hypothetical protein LHGZ1_1532 [Laribacter hongkongensis]|uniref:Uncharacterized protein n=1 Tax=Laribacter hongkongensis TaxID=168471 RepID=A0A248LJL2_9NEIS|nr:hypothetical protein LHGZ1_1532 [Laribacter hongkongensis]